MEHNDNHSSIYKQLWRISMKCWSHQVPFPVWFIGINSIWFENIWYWDPNPWMHKILKFLAVFNISFKVSVWLLIYGIQLGNLGWEIA